MHADEMPPPVQMVQLLAGFQISQALYAAAKTGLPDGLRDGPRRAGDLAAQCGTDPDATFRLLRSLAGFGIFTQSDGDTFALTPLGQTLVSDAPNSMRDMALMWMETHYLPFNELVHTVRTGECAATHYYGQPFFDWLAPQPEQVARFTGAMANLTHGIRSFAVASFDFTPFETIVDVGGADGTLLAQVLATVPRAHGVVLDLPHVVDAARATFAAAGLSDRTELVGGDFFAAVPKGGDAYVLSMVLHDWDDDRCRRILENIRSAAPDAALLLVELVVPDGDAPHMSKAIDLTMLGMLTGRERSRAEWESLLSSVGYELRAVHENPTPVPILEARPLP